MSFLGRMITGACIAGLASSAGAQQGIAVYSIHFGSPTGPNWIMPTLGEPFSVFVHVTFSPGPGQPFGGGAVLSLSDGSFSIIGSGPGRGSWILDTNTASPTYSLPNPWGAQAMGGVGVSAGTPSGNSLAGVYWGLGFIQFPPFYPQNPANVWRGQFVLTDPGQVLLSFGQVSPTGVFHTTATGLPSHSFYSTFGGAAFIGVPGPGAAAPLACGALAAARRRRPQERCTVR